MERIQVIKMVILKVDEVANLLNGDFGYRRPINPEKVMRVDDEYDKDNFF